MEPDSTTSTINNAVNKKKTVSFQDVVEEVGFFFSWTVIIYIFYIYEVYSRTNFILLYVIE